MNRKSSRPKNIVAIFLQLVKLKSGGGLGKIRTRNTHKENQGYSLGGQPIAPTSPKFYFLLFFPLSTDNFRNPANSLCVHKMDKP
jgi:hypothetical protein